MVIGRRSRLPGSARLAMALVRDHPDPNALHRFLWSHHLGYATRYEDANEFGTLTEARRVLFDDLHAYLASTGADPSDIRSIFEVGCSAGYLLRHLETDVFCYADVIEGLDIDGQAIEQGREQLAAMGSRVRLHHADMADLARVLGDRTFDVLVCAGVLMYLDTPEATEVVRTMLRHGDLIVLAGLAHPDVDNSQLAASTTRDDRTFIHDLDSMVERAGGRVVSRRWEGARLFGGYTVYHVFAELG